MTASKRGLADTRPKRAADQLAAPCDYRIPYRMTSDYRKTTARVRNRMHTVASTPTWRNITDFQQSNAVARVAPRTPAVRS